jgi:hypothetical protein
MGSGRSHSLTPPFRRRLATAVPLAALAALVCAGSASAAYAPRLAVTVAPPKAGAPVALGVDVTQESGEESTQSIRLTLPGFTLSDEVGQWPACTGSDESSGTCPAASRMGSVSSSTGFGDFAGDVFFGGMSNRSPRVIFFLKNSRIPLVLDQEVQGRLEAVPGGQELVFDNLPSALATHLSVHLDAKDRLLVAAPTRCGNYDLLGRFTSSAGGHEEAGSRIGIGGCPGTKPAISQAKLSPRRLTGKRATTLSFWLSEPASVRVTMRKAGTRRVRTVRRLAGKSGRNRVTGLGRSLASGRYLFTIKATTADGSSARTVSLRVARSG